MVSVTGTDIYAKRSSNGKVIRLTRGSVLYLHDIIAAGPGSRATLHISRPPSVRSDSEDLVDFYKLLTRGRPSPSSIVHEFFVAAGAANVFGTVHVTREGHFIDITLR